MKLLKKQLKSRLQWKLWTEWSKVFSSAFRKQQAQTETVDTINKTDTPTLVDNKKNIWRINSMTTRCCRYYNRYTIWWRCYTRIYYT